MAAEHALVAITGGATAFGAMAERDRVQQVAKPLMAPALAVRVLRKWRRGHLTHTDGALLTAGLGAATVGDICMLRPDEDGRIVLGASSFAIMQLAYTALLARHGARPTPAAALPRLAATGGMAALLAAKAPAVAAVLSAYGLTLTTMSTMAASQRMPRRLELGGLVFTLSDGLIALRRCLLTNARSRNAVEGVIVTSYALAQFLLIEGMLAQTRRA